MHLGTGQKQKHDETMSNKADELCIGGFHTLLENQQHALEALLHDHLVQQAQVLKDNLLLLQRSPSMMDKDVQTHQDQPSGCDSEATHPCCVQEEIKRPRPLVDASHDPSFEDIMFPTPSEEIQVSRNNLASTRIISMWRCVICFFQRRIMCCFRWLQEYEPEAEGPMQKFVHSTMFRGVISTVIVVNAITLGLMTQSRTQVVILGGQANPVWDTVETCFGCIFLFELLLRFAAERMSFIIGANRRWNLFDALIVATSLLDSAVANAPNLSVARILRIIRFVRILRVVRVLRSSHTFRLMLIQTLASMWNLVWLSMFLLFILYSSAIFFMSGITEAYPSADEDMQAVMHDYYGSLLETMLSLFMSISGGYDWAKTLKPFRSTMPLYPLSFVVFIFAMLFGMLNIVVASFCEAAAEASRRDRDAIIEHQLVRAQTIAADIKNFFESADRDQSGCISLAELHCHLKDDRIKAFFASLEIDVTQAEDLFYLLDTDDSGNIGLDEFLGGCMRLRGAASSMDVNLLLWETEKMMCKLSEFTLGANTRFEWLEDKLGCPQRHTSGPVMPRKKRFRNEVWTGSKNTGFSFRGKP